MKKNKKWPHTFRVGKHFVYYCCDEKQPSWRIQFDGIGWDIPHFSVDHFDKICHWWLARPKGKYEKSHKKYWR